MNIKQLKIDVKDMIEALTNLTCYYDFVPLGQKQVIFLNKGVTSCVSRTLDGDAVKLEHEFDIVVADFTSADSCDDTTSSVVNAIDGEKSAEFQLVKVESIQPIDYDPENGFYANVITAVFVTHE